MILNTWALSLIGSTLAKISNEKNTKMSIMEKSICPFSVMKKDASASPTEPHFNARRCRLFDGINPHSIFKWIRLLSPTASESACMDAPLCPKDFTTESPLAYSKIEPVISRFAFASTGAFFVLYQEITSKKTKDTAAAASAISAVTGLNTQRQRNTTRKFR